jgi:hypothetical protein
VCVQVCCVVYWFVSYNHLFDPTNPAVEKVEIRMETRRKVGGWIPIPSNMNEEGNFHGKVDGESRSKALALKRTISKCSIDPSTNSMDGKMVPKKFASITIQEQEVNPVEESVEDHSSGDQFLFDDEPVLLPLSERMEEKNTEHYLEEEPEVSPVQFDWSDPSMNSKERYYNSILESTAHITSPSPRHVFYASTPSSVCSTVSIGSNASTYASEMSSMNGENNDYLSASNLYVVVVEYIQEVFMYCCRAKTMTFAQLGHTVQSIPFALRHIQSLVRDRLRISWHLVGSFVQNVVEFICDEDIRDATVYEFASFLRSVHRTVFERMPGNIFVNLFDFFQRVLEKFNKFLTKTWIEAKKIEFPCEFGKKSETLFLCMECHREHL